MPAPAIELDVTTARRFQRRLLLLDDPRATIDDALAHLGYVQIDPINVCGRMHDLILRNRVTGYREGDLMRHLHGNGAPLPAAARAAFEHHLPDTSVLVAFPLEAWPHLLSAMRARTRRPGAWSGRLTPREADLAAHILAEIAERGPLSSSDIADRRRAHRTVWGAASLAKSTLQKLFFHGRVLIARREGSRRFYDLPERVLPASVLAAPEPTKAATARWLTLLKLRQRRLTTLKREELKQVADTVQPIAVVGCPTLFCLRTDVSLLDEIGHSESAIGDSTAPRLLAPLDPLIYDRKLTARLWGFDYTWEVYTPPHKRVRGYYALPVLAGTDLVGHLEPKSDAAGGSLRVASRRVRRGIRTAGTVRELAAFLGLATSSSPWRPGPSSPRVRTAAEPRPR
jgi:uncharacterized protein YcaQ